jgi:hypothetical protein
MESDNKFAQWAALFVSGFSADAGTAPQSLAPGIQYPGLTGAAGDLLRAVDAGGVPAFVTGNLKQIARDNGVEAADDWTPNEIVEAIRSKARDSASGDSDLAG